MEAVEVGRVELALVAKLVVGVVLVIVDWVAVVVKVLDVTNSMSHPFKATKAKKNVRVTSAGASDPKASSISPVCPVRQALLLPHPHT